VGPTRQLLDMPDSGWNENRVPAGRIGSRNFNRRINWVPLAASEAQASSGDVVAFNDFVGIRMTDAGGKGHAGTNNPRRFVV